MGFSVLQRRGSLVVPMVGTGGERRHMLLAGHTIAHVHKLQCNKGGGNVVEKKQCRNEIMRNWLQHHLFDLHRQPFSTPGSTYLLAQLAEHDLRQVGAYAVLCWQLIVFEHLHHLLVLTLNFQHRPASDKLAVRGSGKRVNSRGGRRFDSKTAQKHTAQHARLNRHSDHTSPSHKRERSSPACHAVPDPRVEDAGLV